MTNGVFCNDAERDELIIRIDEKQQKILEDISEIKHMICELQKEYETRLARVEEGLVYTKVWVGIFSAIFIPIVVYLFQRLL